MAIAIYPDGRQQDIIPRDGLTFSVYDISELLNGIVEIAFVGNNWVFINKLGAKIGLTFNQICTQTFGFPIYGVCLMVPNEELPKQFFIPNEPPPYLQKLIQMMSMHFDNTENLDDGEDDDDSLFKKITTEKETNKPIDENKMEPYLRGTYDLFFNSYKTFDEIWSKFVIYDDGKQVLELPYDKEIRLQLLDKMLLLFQQKEEYEKCTNIIKLKDYIKEKY